MNLRNIDWDKYQSDAEIMAFLKTLPRYKNNALKSLYYRALFFLNLVLCKITGKEKPLFVVLVTNNNCNLDCTYCYGEYGKRGAKDNYSTKKLLQIIDELKGLGSRLLTVHGGEALLRKDIGEVLNYMKHLGFYIGLNTNGYLVPKRIDELMCLDAITFSVDGYQESNDRNRGAGCFQKVMEGMEVTLARKIPTVISATLTGYVDAIRDLDFLAELGKEKGVRIQYSILYNHDKLANQDHYDGVVDNERMRELIAKIKVLKNQGYPIYYADKVLDMAIKWPVDYGESFYVHKEDMLQKKEQLKNTDFIPCYHGKLKYQIDADGRVIRCWAHDKKDAPNIKTLGVTQALKACNQDDACQHCAFLANNEHNALLDLNMKSLVHVGAVQISELLKMGGKGRVRKFLGEREKKAEVL